MARLFVAVDVPDEIRAKLSGLRASDLAGARWVKPEQLHLTIRFLGAVPDDDVPALRERLAGLVPPPAFHLSLAGVGVFPPRPSRRAPAKVLWAGVTPAEPVAALKSAIDVLLGPDPETVGRPFHPHVTLARFNDSPGATLRPYLDRHASVASAAFAVSGFRLYESRTQPDGPVYTAVGQYPLSPIAKQAPSGQPA